MGFSFRLTMVACRSPRRRWLPDLWLPDDSVRVREAFPASGPVLESLETTRCPTRCATRCVSAAATRVAAAPAANATANMNFPSGGGILASTVLYGSTIINKLGGGDYCTLENGGSASDKNQDKSSYSTEIIILLRSSLSSSTVSMFFLAYGITVRAAACYYKHSSIVVKKRSN